MAAACMVVGYTKYKTGLILFPKHADFYNSVRNLFYSHKERIEKEIQSISVSEARSLIQNKSIVTKQR